MRLSNDSSNPVESFTGVVLKSPNLYSTEKINGNYTIYFDVHVCGSDGINSRVTAFYRTNDIKVAKDEILAASRITVTGVRIENPFGRRIAFDANELHLLKEIKA